MKEPKKNYESNFFSLLKERNNWKQKQPPSQHKICC